MPSGMFNFQEKPGYSQGTPRVSQGAAASVERSYAALNAAVQRSSAAIMDTFQATAEKDKKLAQQADESAWNTFLKTKLAEADRDASRLHNEEKISARYKTFYDELTRYVDGEDKERGVKNVRYDEHRQFLREQLPTLKTLADNHRATRAKAAEQEVSAAKFKNDQQIAERQGEAPSAGNAARRLGETQALAPDEIEMNVRAAMRNADVGKAQILLNKISETDDVELAENLAEDLEADLEEGVEFEHLEAEDKTRLRSNARGEVATVKRRVEQKRVEQERAGALWVMEQIEADPNKRFSQSELEENGVSIDRRIKIMSAQREIEQGKKAEKVALELLPQVLAYDPADDKDLSKAFDLSIAVKSLPGEYGFLSTIFNEQRQAITGKPGAKSKAHTLGEIAKFLLSDNPKNGKATDFKFGWGLGSDEWTNEQAVKQVALEQDRFLRWVEQAQPTDEEILEYTETNPRWKKLRSSKNIENFIRSADRPDGPRKVSEIMGSQRDYGGQLFELPADDPLSSLYPTYPNQFNNYSWE